MQNNPSNTQKTVTTSSTSPAVNSSQSSQAPMMKKIPKENSSKSTMLLVVASLVVVLAGVGAGWMFSGGMSSPESQAPTGSAAPGVRSSTTEAGVEDESTFADEAVGILMEGGIEGEGTHYLDRGAGPEKQVYLTSTVIDLQQFVGKNVHVWGETIAAKHAPWLMDVGKLKVEQE